MGRARRAKGHKGKPAFKTLKVKVDSLASPMSARVSNLGTATPKNIFNGTSDTSGTQLVFFIKLCK